MLMSRASRLAIEALVELAEVDLNQWTTAEELSRRTTAEPPFLQQILSRLARQGLIRSRQGRHGGYQLACDPKKLALRAVIDAIDGAGLRSCLLDSTGCDGWRGCRVAPTWHPIREMLASFLETETIESIAERSRAEVDRFEWADLNG